MLNTEQCEEIWAQVEGIGHAMLVSRDEDVLRARPMKKVQPTFDGKLWFLTRLDAPKTDEIADEHDVCVTFSEPSQGKYVSLSGAARVKRDQTMIDMFWTPDVAEFLAIERTDNALALIEIEITQAEYWCDERKTMIGYLEHMIQPDSPQMPDNRKYN